MPTDHAVPTRITRIQTLVPAIHLTGRRLITVLVGAALAYQAWSRLTALPGELRGDLAIAVVAASIGAAYYSHDGRTAPALAADLVAYLLRPRRASYLARRGGTRAGRPVPTALLPFVPTRISNGVALTRNGRVTAAVRVPGAPMGLLSTEEFDSVEGRYHGFVATLSGPAQFHSRTYPADLSGFAEARRARLRGLPEALVEAELADIAAMEEESARRGLVMFDAHVIVSRELARPDATRRRGRRLHLIPWRPRRGRAAGPIPDAAALYDAAVARLAPAARDVEAGVLAVGLGGSLCDNLDTARLLHRALSPRLARLQPITGAHLKAALVPIAAADDDPCDQFDHQEEENHGYARRA